MKIYYYYFEPWKKRVEKYIHNVEEKKMTYKVTDTRLEHMLYVSVRKNEIGKVVSKWLTLYVVLTEDDDEMAKKLFAEYYYGLIDEKRKEIDEMRELIKENFSESEE